jgi:hypothetical protein
MKEGLSQLMNCPLSSRQMKKEKLLKKMDAERYPFLFESRGDQ